MKIIILILINIALLASPFSNIKDTKKVLELSKKTDLFIEGEIVESEALYYHRIKKILIDESEINNDNAGKLTIVTKFTVKILEKFNDNIKEKNKKINVWIYGGSDNYEFTVKELNHNSDYLWNQNGYGHYSLASREYTNNPYKTVNLLNRITKAARNVVRNLRFVIYKSGDYWKADAISSHNSNDDYYSRTGYSIVYNIRKQLYKYFWIEE